MAFSILSVNRRKIAACLLGVWGLDLCSPLASYALTSGPSQPEFSSFEPVSTNQMVDPFTGDFTYNIPVLNVPGPQGSDYPLSLSYHSGTTPEEEASWVGYGWSLNPGAINRNTRGFPDDFTGAPVKYWNKMPANVTVTAGIGSSVEAFSIDFGNVSASIRHNNYQGYGYNVGFGVSLGKGFVSLGYGISDGQGSFSASVNPVKLLTRNKDFQQEAEASAEARFPKQAAEAAKKQEKLKVKPTGLGKISLLGGNHSLFTFSEGTRPNHTSSYFGGAFNVSSGLQVNPLIIPLGSSWNVFGSLAWQKNFEADETIAYGYMYSHDGMADENSVNDYYTEKDSPYNQRDIFLGIPFNNADIFSVSGEGVGGGFRLYHETVADFAPNFKRSNTVIANLSVEGAAGTTFGGGVDFGAGWQYVSEGKWDNGPKTFSEANNSDDKVFFRFANDLGGEMGGAGNQISDAPVAANLNYGLISSSLNRSNINALSTVHQTHSRASYIGYHTADDVRYNSSRAFSHRSDLPVSYNWLSGGAITEMSVSAATGSKYIYGLPLLSKAEANLQYGVKFQYGNTDQLFDNYIVSTTKTDGAMDVKVGEERSEAYASSFPLTEIQSPDYVDRTLDGPTEDDFGGYTKFSYKKQYGENSSTQEWYNWRIPYNGLLYQANSLSDTEDDMGGVSYGQKEVAHLHSVATKTHTAFFILSAQDRDDSRDAGEEAEGPGSPRSRNGGSSEAVSNRGLKSLQRIDLYANSDIEPDGATGYMKPKISAKPIKSVHFEYNYNLFSSVLGGSDGNGLPNAVKNSNTRQGKLTLTRIWYEYQGVPTKISPYTFGYQYPDYSSYPSIYNDNVNNQAGADNVTSGYKALAQHPNTAKLQNPAYSPFAMDAWGNYRYNGQQRARILQSWVDQGNNVPEFDPAAWQLKVITLPTGGQIHVQYEQDDYAYVQNRPAHAMVSLAIDGETVPNGPLEESKYYLNLSSLGMSTPTQSQLLAVKNAIEEEYKLGGNRRIFFKFLYMLSGNNTPNLYDLTCNTDYISGYAPVKTVGFDIRGVYIVLGNDSNDGYTLPKQACVNFVETQRAGKLSPPGNCDPSRGNFQADRDDPVRSVRDLLAWQLSITGLTSKCAKLNPSLSYFRIPLIQPKKGGGLRVKRLLTFDNTGLDGEAVLYGSEYIYKTKDAAGKVISSGVATTEPAGMREENILVDYLPRQGQSQLSKIISGEDRKQSEGPIGESMLPAPSVGYSRVVTRNIHSGRTTSGYSISEFATARDYPMIVKTTTMQTDTKFLPGYGILVNIIKNNTYATQGYSVILNSMHGQMLRQAAYPGEYPGETSTTLPSPTSEQINTYFAPPKMDVNQALTPAQAVPLMSERGGSTAASFPGREIDVTFANRAVKDNMLDLNFELDTDIALFFIPIGYITFFPSITDTQAELYTHVTSKVVRYPAILSKTETLQDGIRHVTENRAFSSLSGEPVVTRSNDEFNGGYLQEKILAAWVHPEFGPKYPTENRLFTTANPMLIELTGNEVWLKFNAADCAYLRKITRGDQLTLDEAGDYVCFAEKPDFVNNKVRLYPASIPLAASLPAALQNGASFTRFRIVQGRKANQLTAAAGSNSYHSTNFQTLTLPANASQLVSSTFTTDLNGWLSGLGTNASGASSTTLSGTYTHMNMSAYANKLPAGCVDDPSDVTINTVKIVAQVIGGQTSISIKEFTVLCNSGAIVVKN